ALSAFGFGGNNAHVLIEEHTGSLSVPEPDQVEPVVVVAVGSILGETRGLPALEDGLFAESTALSSRAAEIEVALEGLRFPPSDLAQTLPQQLLILEASRDAIRQVRVLPSESTGAIVGMGCDPNVARYGGRWRLADWCESWGIAPLSPDTFIPSLASSGVVGAMPNIVANRLNSQLDLGGASMAVSSEELSGIRALQVASRALQRRELDAALVGAVDLSCDPVHEAAARAEGLTHPAADGAVVLVLKRQEDALRDGERVLAVLDGDGTGHVQGAAVADRWGHPHAASGLFEVAAAALCCARGRHIGGEVWSGERSLTLDLQGIGGQQARVVVSSLGADRVPPQNAETASGPTLTFDAHLPPVRIPEPHVHDETKVQVMVAAPTLPPVLGGDSGLIFAGPPA
ncbi:MAG: beta-ketoacyl synthase N-terminal-like domain-containing protein, partial [Myxococcota bacterium]|nr:beta-ketoacyl synthase N-terminal-like domain-containing protein [Myxococcota bacterium]